ncbi:phage regulatory CII family protein [Frateuria aurantia]|uniref:Phage regulatory protein CII (CP76) n=1 Tax=Frateuria aurantia (strain ATCC 33424 / DSM 6220 / KCTC 2777 / LMG 1558 / NBRC 3245 / NCIMB 13370) TaxID=767434 RepID=H8L1T7_FRAAD|nr:phage regulatory CII family protein [Frateuria aurantia]AFC86348.1 Phage regulatory protein CII (CP76) [Frateuria aurantia DSM 6220]
MNVVDAAHATVHDYPGGAETLALRLGLQAGILRHKVNPTYDRNHLTLAEADRLMGITGDVRILHALAASHGFALTPLDQVAQQKEDDVTALVLELVERSGGLAGTVRESLADGVITHSESKDTSHAGHLVQDIVVRLVAAIARKVRRQ